MRSRSGLIILLTMASCRGQQLANLGECAVTTQSIKYQQDVFNLTADAGVKLSDDIAIARGLRICVGQHLMKKYGHEVTDELLQKEVERINKDTKRPEILQKVKGVFGGENEKYRKSYIRHVYVGRKVYNEVLRWNPRVQSAARQHAEKFRTLATAGKSLKKLAKIAKTQTYRVELSSDKGWVQVAPGYSPGIKSQVNSQLPEADNNERLKWARELLENEISKAKKGTMLGQVIEFDNHFAVARFIRKKRSTYYLECMNLPKRGFDDILKEEMPHITIHFKSKEMLDRLLPANTWMAGVKATYE